MATFVIADDATFDVMTGGVPSVSTTQFLEQERQRAAEQFQQSQWMAQCSEQFLQRTHQLIEQVENSDAIRYAQAARRAIGQMWYDQSIRLLSTIADFQWAPLPMVRWIMAEPTVNQWYRDQRLEGYDGYYQNPFPEQTTPTENLDYRHVTNGVVLMNADDAGPEWSASTYYDDREDVIPMDFLEQCDVIHSWENIRHWLKQGEDDPTSRFNASL